MSIQFSLASFAKCPIQARTIICEYVHCPTSWHATLALDTKYTLFTWVPWRPLSAILAHISVDGVGLRYRSQKSMRTVQSKLQHPYLEVSIAAKSVVNLLERLLTYFFLRSLSNHYYIQVQNHWELSSKVVTRNYLLFLKRYHVTKAVHWDAH